MGVGALLQVDELAGAVVEGGVGEAEGGAEGVGDLLVGVGVAGVGDRRIFEERLRGLVGVLGVAAEEGDALAVAGRELLQDRELEAAGPAPGGPDVGDDGVALQRRDPPFVGPRPAGQQLVVLRVQRRQRRRRPGQGAVLISVLTALVTASATAASGRAEGAGYPSIEWRRDFSLVLGLERLLADEPPKLRDGAELSPHQVDALSGPLAGLMAQQQIITDDERRNGDAAPAEVDGEAAEESEPSADGAAADGDEGLEDEELEEDEELAPDQETQ